MVVGCEYMEKNNKMIIIASLGIAMVLLIGWIFFNSKTDLENAKIKQAKEELKEYQAEILASANGYNPEDYTEETMKKELIETVSVAQNNYAGDSVGVYALDIQTTINGFTGTAEEILNQTIAFLEELDVNGMVSKVVANNVEPTKTLTLKSTTVCETEEIEKEYCLDGETTKLSANAYVHDQQSTKWVVLLHPAMMNGSVTIVQASEHPIQTWQER
jgi:hypothetical protein